MSSNIGNFLAEQVAEGQRVDSGEFTLDSAKARAKLAEFALSEPGLWVVKIVQSAVACGAPDIEFVMPKREVKVCFLNKPGWCAEKICSFVLSARVPPDRAMAHFQAGILGSSLGEVTDRLSWECGGKRVSLDSRGVSVQDVEDDGYLKLHLRRSQKPSVSVKFFNTPLRYYFRETAHEFHALVERCRCSPIPVQVDGYMLPRHYAQTFLKLPTQNNYDSENPSGRASLLTLIPLTELPEAESLAYPLRETLLKPEPRSYDEHPKFSPTQLPLDEGRRARGVVALYSGLQRRSQINYLLDGALIESRVAFSENPISKAFPALERALNNNKDDFPFDLYLAITPERVDLSHFQVRDLSFAGLGLELCLALKRTFEQIRDNCDKPWDFFHLYKPDFNSVKNVSAGEIVGTGVASLFIPHLLVVGASVLVAGPLFKLYKPRGDKKKAKELKIRLEVVISDLGEIVEQIQAGGNFELKDHIEAEFPR